MTMSMDMDIIDDKFIDIHNHLIHEVDDGSKNIEMSKELLKIFYNQGVKILFLTPHLNSPASKTNFSEINKNFRLIKEIANKIGIKCYLGYEIYIPFYLPKINFSDYTMGNSNVLLLEFSHYDDSPIKEHVYNLIKRGFRIIIAHIERYDYLDLYDIFELKDMGVYLQVNASSIIEKKNKNRYKRAKLLIKNNLIDFIASDAHNTTSRPPNIKKAFEILSSKIGIEKSRKLFYKNQCKLFIDIL